MSISYQLAQTLGLSPLVAAALLAAGGGGTNTALVAGFLLVATVLSAAAVRVVPETRTRDLTDPALDARLAAADGAPAPQAAS